MILLDHSLVVLVLFFLFQSYTHVSSILLFDSCPIQLPGFHSNAMPGVTMSLDVMTRMVSNSGDVSTSSWIDPTIVSFLSTRPLVTRRTCGADGSDDPPRYSTHGVFSRVHISVLTSITCLVPKRMDGGRDASILREDSPRFSRFSRWVRQAVDGGGGRASSQVHGLEWHVQASSMVSIARWVPPRRSITFPVVLSPAVPRIPFLLWPVEPALVPGPPGYLAATPSLLSGTGTGW